MKSAVICVLSAVFICLGSPVPAQPATEEEGFNNRARAALERVMSNARPMIQDRFHAGQQPGALTSGRNTPGSNKVGNRLGKALSGATTQQSFRAQGAMPDADSERFPNPLQHSPARFRDDGSVQVYVKIAQTDPDTLEYLGESGLIQETVNHRLKTVQGWIPVERLDDLASLPTVVEINTPDYATARIGSRLTEGDMILRADLLRLLNLGGAGVRVGIISDGANDWTEARDSGDLPASGITVYGSCAKQDENEAACDPGADCNEGTAMAEIIHDIAPDASIAVGAANTSLEFIDRLDDLVNGFGADIIVDDLGFRSEPFLEDGPVAAAVAAVSSSVLYVSAVGNSADTHHESAFIDQDPSPTVAVHDFGVASGQASDWAFPVYADQFGLGVVFLQWSDPFGASGNDYDLHVDIYNADNGDYIDTLSSTQVQDGTQDPAEFTGFCNPFNHPIVGLFYVLSVNGDDSFLEIQSATNGNSGVIDYAMAEGSVFGHPAVSDVLAVGAIRANDPGHDDIEFFSSQGPARIFNPVVEIRNKPDLVAIDGVSVTGSGGFVETFFGTSAAAPHVAGIAALIKEAMPHATSSELRDILVNSAIDLGDPGPDWVFGAGRVDALDAEQLADTDDDGEPNGTDIDDDGDNLEDTDELLAGTYRLDADSDDDSILDGADILPLDPLACADTDADQCDDCSLGTFDPAMDGRDTNADGTCDVGDTDDDGDMVTDNLDNCPWVVNLDQTDMDNNGIGDVCQQCAMVRMVGARYQRLCL